MGGAEVETMDRGEEENEGLEGREGGRERRGREEVDTSDEEAGRQRGGGNGGRELLSPYARAPRCAVLT